MKSLRFKVMLPVIIMVMVFIAIIYVQISSVRSSLKMITEMNEKYFATLSKAESLKLDVVQVQQWLTDISATRAAKGYDDGFTEAEKHAQNVKTMLNDLEKIDPEQKEELNKIEQDFEPYYEMGKKMADAYISGGPLKGNETMDEFDKTAESINNSVDSFKEKSTERITYSIENIKKSVQNSIVLSVMSIIVVIALLVFAAMYITKAIVKPIKRLERQFNELAENGGDLTQQIEISSKDEIGHLASSVNRFIDNLRTVMIEVNKSSNSVEKAANLVFKSLMQLDANIEEASSTVEELSAGMEETAAETEQVNVSSEQMGSYIESMARKAQNGAAASGEISTKAKELKSNTIKSEQRAQEIYEEAKEKLETALEQSKAVEKINLLSEAILQISSQTNLLALNASIESARAGEAGRGFAVVADEIRKLAEDSKTTVNEIQRITKEVVSFVENLSSGARAIMEFMEIDVRRDYEGMLKTGEYYSNDAILINELVTDFSGTAEELTTSIEEIAKAISNVAKTVDEGVAGTQNIAEKTSEIVKQVNLVRNQMQISMESSQRLRDVVDKFVV